MLRVELVINNQKMTDYKELCQQGRILEGLHIHRLTVSLSLMLGKQVNVLPPFSSLSIRPASLRHERDKYAGLFASLLCLHSSPISRS